jgi:selenocysteine-specific elongation factor
VSFVVKMSDKNFILATAGHVDHGKSALVKALTGTDPDRLPEEKARGITIDLGFAELTLDRPNGEKFHIGIVDVPGHEDFVRNMIAGVGSIDLALLVVAADDGWMPQTEEHLQILEYLGVKRIIVALTKGDLGKIDVVTAQIREELKETSFNSCQIVPTSIRTGEGIHALMDVFVSELAQLPPPRDFGKPRLFVDRAFTLRGVGTVVTGTLSGGILRVGDSVFVQPKGIVARIRSLQTHGRNAEMVNPGTRTAINLPDLQLLTDVKRGDVISTQSFEATSRLDVVLNRSPRLQHTLPVKSGSSTYVHHGTTRTLAKIILAERDSLAPGESTVAQLRLEAPLLAFVGDRLVVRDPAGRHTIAGAIVFHIDSNNIRSSKERALLAARAVAPDDVALAVWTEIGQTAFIEPSRLLDRSRFSASEITTALQKLRDHREIFLSEKVAAKMVAWRDLRERVARRVDAEHKAHPERRGLELNDLRIELNSLSPAVFNALIVDLCQAEFVRDKSAIARRVHRANLPPELEAAAEKIRAALSATPFDPPDRKRFSEDRNLNEALRFLVDHGEVIELNREIVLLRSAIDEMQKTVVALLSTNRTATASEIRQKIGTTRRVIIPFLEYIDRIGVTQREGDLRKLRDAKTATIARS